MNTSYISVWVIGNFLVNSHYKSKVPGIHFLTLLFYTFWSRAILYGETGATLLLWLNYEFYEIRLRDSI